MKASSASTQVKDPADWTPATNAPKVDWAFDTETQDGKAILCTVAGPGQSYYWEPVSFADCFRQLSGFAGKFMAYNMDYDARALIKWIPESLWKTLYASERVEWRGFRINYRSGRFFTVAKGKRSFTIYDLAVHFQKSLAEASRELLKREAKSSIPRSWYPKMAAVLRAPATRKRVLAYALADAEACRDLWYELRRQLEELKVPAQALAHPVSPGAVAAAFFGDRLRFDLSWDANVFAERAYAGGRIEVYKRGYFPKVWIYDLKSAYPWSLSKLPDPRELDFVRDDAERDDYVYAVYKVRAKIPRTCLYPPVPMWHPKKTLRLYPVGDYQAWVTDPEMRLLRRKGWLTKILAASYLVGERKPWLTEIPRLYRERRTNPGMAQAIKLVLNSVYGKLAQKDGRYVDSDFVGGGARTLPGTFLRRESRFSTSTNFFVASYVTAMIRLRLFEIMEWAGPDVVLAATDGLMLTRPLPKSRLGSELGDWSLQAEGAKAIVVGAGMYSVYHEGKWTDKSRGHRLDRPLREVLRTDRTKIGVTQQIAYTLGDYFMRGADLNVITKISKTVNVNFDEKRVWPCDWERARDILKTSQTSRPLMYFDSGSDGVKS